ncbi:MAG: hypothetical protein K6F81_00500 [Acholeplasmatales bacterium]|nr:hypothetical protein [Acholeplasmatales bacterium]
MKRKILPAMSLTALFILSSCGAASVSVSKIGKCDELNEDYEAFCTNRTSDEFNDSYNKFASNVSEIANESENNSCISPISVYSALSMLSFSTSGNTQTEILKYLNTTEEELKINYSKLFISSNYYDDAIDDFRETLFNSLWIQKEFEYKKESVESVAKNACADIFKIDFTNKYAGKYISNYVKDKTNDLIDQEINIDSSTQVALVNTLYLNDPWLRFGDDISVTNEQINFINSDNTISKDNFMIRSTSGKIYSNLDVRVMCVSTYNRYKITFIVPNENKKISDVFNEKNINEAINANYFDYDQDKYIYETTTKFPKFNAESKYDLVEALQNKGIKDVFSSNADFSPISNTDLSCSQVIHSTKLGVDRKGIIGAAMTYVMTDGAAAPDRRTKIYEEFIVDRAFGYLVSDRYNRIIFSGIINKI